MNAVESIRSEFERFAEARPAGEPAWLPTLRKAALARFAELGFPTRGLEDWRYTNLAPLARRGFRLAPPDARPLTRSVLEALAFPVFACSVHVFLNGRYLPELSSPRRPGGGGVESLACALAQAPATVEAALARTAPPEERALVALNTAFLGDGALVHLPAGEALEAPIHLVWVSAPDGAPTMSHPRTLVLAEPGSRATLIEDYVTLGDGESLTTAVSEVVLAEGARLEHVKLQREGEAAHHLGFLQVRQGRGSRLVSHSISLGAALARHEIATTLDAEDAECLLSGLYAVTGTQLVDHHTTVDHARPRGTSRELYKGILGGQARGVFNGKVIVRPGAQHTDSRQTNKNLLVSAGAEVNSKPELEIAADDVRCSHGSSIGSLDEGALFYLRSRGLDEASARALLTRAFASEIVDAIPVEPLRERIHELLLQRLAGALPGLGAT